MSHEHNSPFAGKEYRYEPDELGLDLNDESDMALYVESEGIRPIGRMLIAARHFKAAYAAGEITEEEYDLGLHSLGNLIESVKERIHDEETGPN